jgi:beta-N-acetylhexosaminidase
VVITDAMDMQAIAGRYGAGEAAALALEAGADMVMALGNRESQEQTLDALAQAIATGRCQPGELAARIGRLDALAARYPSASGDYRLAPEDNALMAQAWRRGLTLYREPVRPALGAKVRLVARADAASDGVSDAGVTAAQVAAMLRRYYDLEVAAFADAESFDWEALPADGRFVILASASRARYGATARRSWRPDLHLALWSPFQAADIAAPALLTYGFAPPALDAVGDWLSGGLEASGICPMAGFDDSGAMQ